MRTRIRLPILVALVALSLADAARAERRWVITGTLDRVAEDRATIQVDQRLYSVTDSTKIQDSSGARRTWADVVTREAGRVDLLIVPGRPYPIVRSLVLADETAPPDAPASDP